MNVWDQLVDCICRPPRDAYTPQELLGGSGQTFFVGSMECTRLDFELTNARGLKIVCSHYLPLDAKSKDGQLPVVVYAHCNSGSRRDAEEAVWHLLPCGIGVVAFDFTGSGLSDGKWVTLGAHEVSDLGTVIAHLRSQGGVSSIGLWGRSMGAVTALLYSHTDPDIAGMVLDSPFSRLTDLMLEIVVSQRLPIPKVMLKLALKLMRTSVRRKAGADINTVSPLDVVGRSLIPAMFGHGEQDSFIDIAHSVKLHEAYNSTAAYPVYKNLVRFKGDHNHPRPAFFYSSVCCFFHQQLKLDQVLLDSHQADAQQLLRHGSLNLSAASEVPFDALDRANGFTNQPWSLEPMASLLPAELAASAAAAALAAEAQAAGGELSPPHGGGRRLRTAADAGAAAAAPARSFSEGLNSPRASPPGRRSSHDPAADAAGGGGAGMAGSAPAGSGWAGPRSPLASAGAGASALDDSLLRPRGQQHHGRHSQQQQQQHYLSVLPPAAAGACVGAASSSGGGGGRVLQPSSGIACSRLLSSDPDGMFTVGSRGAAGGGLLGSIPSPVAADGLLGAAVLPPPLLPPGAPASTPAAGTAAAAQLPCSPASPGAAGIGSAASGFVRRLIMRRPGAGAAAEASRASPGGDAAAAAAAAPPSPQQALPQLRLRPPLGSPQGPDHQLPGSRGASNSSSSTGSEPPILGRTAGSVLSGRAGSHHAAAAGLAAAHAADDLPGAGQSVELAVDIDSDDAAFDPDLAAAIAASLAEAERERQWRRQQHSQHSAQHAAATAGPHSAGAGAPAAARAEPWQPQQQQGPGPSTAEEEEAMLAQAIALSLADAAAAERPPGQPQQPLERAAGRQRPGLRPRQQQPAQPTPPQVQPQLEQQRQQPTAPEQEPVAHAHQPMEQAELLVAQPSVELPLTAPPAPWQQLTQLQQAAPDPGAAPAQLLTAPAALALPASLLTAPAALALPTPPVDAQQQEQQAQSPQAAAVAATSLGGPEQRVQAAQPEVAR